MSIAAQGVALTALSMTAKEVFEFLASADWWRSLGQVIWAHMEHISGEENAEMIPAADRHTPT